MECDAFQIAARAAASANANVGWDKLSLAEQCAAIYQELRKLDIASLRAVNNEWPRREKPARIEGLKATRRSY
jgi:hypothetical protein